MNRETALSYGLCGLNCNLCEDKTNGECHGCECPDRDCAADWHQKHCRIYQCVKKHNYVTCADCEELPCSMLNAFICDPKHQEHSQCFGNLLRIRRIGLEEWIDEQEAFWQDPAIHK
ncbi:MAG: DUF3795 domain-containing protein [Anaerolineaceae bacterium]